ncbi:hypothetical protein [Halalkalibaculum sp. DA384]|uniref:hypothetical protein n=1 Tax=Halalkalibaculum sp. DA384 TaxID=3373606 RepID=UPI003754563A
MMKKPGQKSDYSSNRGLPFVLIQKELKNQEEFNSSGRITPSAVQMSRPLLVRQKFFRPGHDATSMK